MKLHLPYLLRRAVVRALFAAATVVTTLASATHADMITPDGRTATQVIQSGNVYDVYTNTVMGRTGFNSFSTFDVYAETTANLHLADGTGRLINVVRDSASHIDGVLNSYKDGRIGGDVYFLNPNGIIVGKTGVVNVGSISMSTPTAAFVEQLIARDGSISATATQAVLAGDMPINEKGTISIKGKVNARGTAELRAGKVEVKGGEINTGVKFREMVNTGKRKMDTQGMSIQDGRLSFGKKPAKARRVAKAEAREKKTENPEKKADIAIFANDVLVDASALNAASVYIDPDTAEIFGTISGEYMVEARAIIAHDLSVKEGETLTSFTLYAANELTDGTYEGNVSITLSNSNIVADELNIFATATSNAAEAIVSITGSTLSAAAQEDGSLSILATSASGSARVEIKDNSTLSATGGVDVAAVSGQGNAAVTLGVNSSASAATVSMAASAIRGNADTSVQGNISGKEDVTITASTGMMYSDSDDDRPVAETEFKSEGGGNAKVTVAGHVESKGALAVSAVALGTYGDAETDITGSAALNATNTEEKKVGNLEFERSEDLTIQEDDTEEAVNEKHQKYLEAYKQYLNGLDSATAAIGTIDIAATSTAGNASVKLNPSTRVESSLATAISAEAAQAASVVLGGNITGGDISASAKGNAATLRVEETGTLRANAHRVFVQEGLIASVEESDGEISLEAGTHDGDQPNPEPLPAKRDGVLLEVAGTLTSSRETRGSGGDAGAISLVSAGKLVIGEGASVKATSRMGEGGIIYLEASEYDMLGRAYCFNVDGGAGSGSILLMNPAELTGDNINNADEISQAFIQKTLGMDLLDADAGGKWDWTGGFSAVSLSGTINLQADVTATVGSSLIADDTKINCNGNSLTLTNSYGNHHGYGRTMTIGNRVSINKAKNFTIDYNFESKLESYLSTYFGAATQLKVGENFKVEATGDVTIKLAGMYNTAISFGKGVDIKAGGDVTISATTRNGQGSNMFASAKTDVLSKIVKLIPGIQDTIPAKVISQIGIVKFDTDKFVKLFVKWARGKTVGDKSIDGKSLNVPQIGVRVSRASVTFADNGTTKEGLNGGTIEGNNVTIASSSTARVSGFKSMENGYAGISLGYIYNNSKVDLGEHLTITAGKSKEGGKVSVTSTTKSTVSLQNVYTSDNKTASVGVLLSVGTDFNTLNINESVQINAASDIKIGTKSTIEAKPFMSMSSGDEQKVELAELPEGDTGENEDNDTSGRGSVMVGMNLLVHENKATVNGKLTSTSGNIDIKSEDVITSTLTMSASTKNTIVKKSQDDPRKGEAMEFVRDVFAKCITLNLGPINIIGDLDADTVKAFAEYKGILRLIPTIGKYENKTKNFYKELARFQNREEAAKFCFDVAIAADIVISNNTLFFGGKAEAKKGSVTLDATSSIEAACGAETSILGVPAENAVCVSLSVPVVSGTTKAQIGEKATITAGGNISVNSATKLPMSLDAVGWRDWLKAVQNTGKDRPADFIKAVRGSLLYLSSYQDNGEFGVLDSLTSSHASTYIGNTGAREEGATAGAGGLVVDVRNLYTTTVVGDGAVFTANGDINLTSSAQGKQATVAGKLPVYLTLSFPPYQSSLSADNGYGASLIVGKKSLNTVTYVGAATLNAHGLHVDATGDAFMLEMSLGSIFGASGNAAQGSVNIILEDKMTVSEISGGATVTLTGDSQTSHKGSVTATDKSTLLNLAGLFSGGDGSAAVGAGVAVTVNKAFTSAMLGNQLAIDKKFEDTWKYMVGDPTKTFVSDKAITLNLGNGWNFSVDAQNTGVMVNVGIAGALKRKAPQLDAPEQDEDENEEIDATVAANVGVIFNASDVVARQNKVNATTIAVGTTPYDSDITTKATEKTTIVSVAADAAINASGWRDTLTMAGALSVNIGRMNTTANVTDCNYTPNPAKPFGKFKVDASNTSTVVAVDVAAGAGAATAGISAGTAFNRLTGNTTSLLSGGSVTSNNVSVTSLTDMASFSFTLGLGVNMKLTINARGESVNRDENGGTSNGEDLADASIREELEAAMARNDADKNEKNFQSGELLNNGKKSDSNEEDLEDWAVIGEEIGETLPEMLDDNGVAFDAGAAIARNVLTMNSSAIVEGCTVTTPGEGELEVTATDTSVITAISLGGGIAKGNGTTIGSGGVFTFAPVNSTTTAAIRQKEGVTGKLAIEAGKLTLHAKDNHRVRLWSFGGGYGETAGIGLVMAWGSFSGALTLAEINNVDAKIKSTADILASSDLSTTFISAGASGSAGDGAYVAITGMVNIMKFNNQVITRIKDSNLTISDEDGTFKALSASNRTFTDGVGAVAFRASQGSPGVGAGAAVSLVYVGGSGAEESNLTEMMVEKSTINNSGTTELLAKSTTCGTAAGLNTSVAAGGTLFGLAGSGSFTWMTDYSFTQVDIKDSFFNKRDKAVEADKDANIIADASSSSDLTFGFGTLALQIGSKAKPGAAVGASFAALKDNATTAASMVGGGVGDTAGFYLHAAGKADLAALVIGGAASGMVGVAGGGLTGTINHQVTAYMEDSVVNMDGALTIAADNTSNVGKGKDTRFTIANGALGLFGGSAGVDVCMINVADTVLAKAHNVSVHSGSMDVLASEYSSADSVSVNVAGGQFAGLNVSVGRVVLRGVAEAAVTADKNKTTDGALVGITTKKAGVSTGDNSIIGSSSGDLNVMANNEQWLRSHLWLFSVTVNPKLPSVAGNVCANSINLAGTANAMIKGDMPLTLGGDLDIAANTNRYLTNTTVPVSAAISLFGVGANLDFNVMRVSNNTSSETGQQIKDAAAKIDDEIKGIAALIKNANIKLTDDGKVGLGTDVGTAMGDAERAINSISKEPQTSAVLDLGGKDATGNPVAGTANVAGDAVILAKDTIKTEPVTVNVTGGMLAVGVHSIGIDLASTVKTTVNNTILNTQKGDIFIDAVQDHGDVFRNVGVTVGAGAVVVSKHNWKDTATTTIKLEGKTKLNAGGSVAIASDSSIHEDYQHVNVAVSGLNVAFVTPTFTQNDTNTITLGEGVSITAGGDVTIKNNTTSNFISKIYDATLQIAAAGEVRSESSLTSNQKLTTGEGVSITGSSVNILQEGTRTINMETLHLAVSGLKVSFPFTTIIDTVEATLSIGNGNTITATGGALTIASDITSNTTLSFGGANAGGLSITQAGNNFLEDIENETKLGNNVTLRGKTMTVRATNSHTADMTGFNMVTSLISADKLTTWSGGGVSSDVTIGTGFDAAGDSLTLEASNTDQYIYTGRKVSISLLLSPFGKNEFSAWGDSKAAVTLAGCKIDVKDFNVKATTDVSLVISQILAGGSLTVDVNIGAIAENLTQTAEVTLGTDSNQLDILTDNASITAHNKHRIGPMEGESSLVVGAGFGALSGNSKGEADAKQTITATVTLGKNAKLRRRADAAHYMQWQDYRTVISATNDVENDMIIKLTSAGFLNANCTVTTNDATTATATLNLNGTIDSWGDTELTAYSHVKHYMVNSVTGGAVIPTFHSWVKNTISTTDTVNINGAVESIGDITIQAGSTAGRYKMVDGNTVLGGDDDTNRTIFRWGASAADISNKRNENLNINANVRAGGELIISNDSSANTLRKPFKKTGTSADYADASVNTAANVTGSVTLGSGAELYAGLSSAVSLGFYVIGGQLTPVMTSAQKILDGSTQEGGVWVASGSEMLQPLYRIGKENDRERLYVNPLTLPGMAFRIETLAYQSVFSGKLNSPGKHGVDILFADSWMGDAQTVGVTLRGYETGLIFNRQAVKDAVKSCAELNLYLKEGVSIRSLAAGNLYITGRYEFPYSTFLAKSEHDLVVSGSVNCGNIVFEAGGNYKFDDKDKDLNLYGPQAIYTGLMEQWESSIPGKISKHAQDVVNSSGRGGKSGWDNNPSLYKPEDPYTHTYSATDVSKAIPARDPKDPTAKGSISASGTVSILAKVVDINGEIYSGIANSNMVIKNDFKVLAPDGKTLLTRAEADALYKQMGLSVFKLDGYTGVSLTYDAKNKSISLNSLSTLECGITIDGIIVNSNPTGAAGLHVAGSCRDINIDNQTGLDLNIGNVDLTTTKSSGITLINRGTGETTTYTPNAQGEWICQVQKTGATTSTTLGLGAQTTVYDSTANYQVLLERQTKWAVTETGRLTFTGSVDGAKKDDICNNGIVGTKKTIVDRLEFAFNDPSSKGTLDASYVEYDAAHPNGFAVSTNTLSNKILAEAPRASGPNRYLYTLKYTNTSDAKLYVNAANSVMVHLGDCTSASSALHVASGNVNFRGTLTATACGVTAGNAITAGEKARLNCDLISMTAQNGSIGSEENRLYFNADTASFSAKGDLYLAHFSTAGRKDANQLSLLAGQNIDLRSDGAINSLDLNVFSSAIIAADGQINVTGGRAGDASDKNLALITLSSDNAGISVTGGDFTHGILTATAERDVNIVSNIADSALTLDYVESRRGNVSINSPGGIYTVRSADMSTPKGAVSFGSSTSFDKQSEAAQKAFADDYYAKLLYCVQLYYEKDEDGKYTHRAADGETFSLPTVERNEELASLYQTFEDIYNSGQGDYLADVMMALSGTDAVEGTAFNDKAAALSYLAAHSGRLHNFAEAYYNKVMAELTREIRDIYVPNENIDYGLFNESTYRLYWLRDSEGRLVHQDGNRNFISPKDSDGQPLFDADMCKAITAQFKSQAPARGQGSGIYKAKDSELLQNLADGSSGKASASIVAGQLKDGPAAFIGGKPIGDMMPTVGAKNGTVTLTTDKEHDIGGSAFHFIIKPIEEANGKFVYSDWAQAFLSDVKRNVWEGVRVAENKAEGEFYITLSSMSFSLSKIDSLIKVFLQHALPLDIETPEGMNLCRVSLRNYFGVDASDWKFKGGNLLLAVNGDVKLSDETIEANNLFLSSTGSISGSLTNTGGGYVNLYADGGIGSKDEAFSIGGNSVFTLGSVGDVFLNVQNEVGIGSISGGHVSVDARNGNLTPTRHDGLDVVAGYIDYYGNLNTGLSFRTTGTSQGTGGLHWHGGGSSRDLAFNALNTSYTFWFVNESGMDPIGKVNIKYSGHFVASGLPKAGNAAFRQAGAGTSGHVLEFAGDQVFDTLTLGGDGAYTVISPGTLTLTSSAVNIGGDATLRLAGIGSVDGNPIHIVSTGNLALGNFNAPDSACLVEKDLVIDSTGVITLNAVTSTGTMVLNGRRGISGREVKARQIVANSPGGGVFLNADTMDLSGSSWNSFVADLEPLDNGTTITMHDISANAMTATVLVRSLSKELKLGGSISGAALRFYSTGDIVLIGGDVLDSDYPFLDVQSSQNPNVETMAIDPVNADLPERFVWDIEHSLDDASRDNKEVQELRRKVNGEDEIPTVPALRFLDKDGNTVSREQYANLITNK